jgi:hypothetical protein
MKIMRAPAAGESRTCPHCKATILQSAASCPMCRHVLKFTSFGYEPQRSQPTTCPLLVEGTLEHPGEGLPLEYNMLMEVRDQTGKLLSRQIIGVGAIRQGEHRIFSLRVEMSSAPSAN